ncbi:hypothetical protein MOUN0_G02014 [Monosporozyma unispora]
MSQKSSSLSSILGVSPISALYVISTSNCVVGIASETWGTPKLVSTFEKSVILIIIVIR